MTDVAFDFAIVCEAAADKRTATALADRVLCDKVDWLDQSQLPALRRWRGGKPGESHLTWSRRKSTLARQRSFRFKGKFGGLPGKPDALAGREILLFFLAQEVRPSAVVLIRDADHQPDRAEGLRQARDHGSERPWPFEVVIGVARSKRECWVLAGFEPVDDAETERHAATSRELGFDPCTTSHQLTAQKKNARTSAKRVLSTLTQNNLDREATCWQQTDLATLRHRGGQNGLADYLDEVSERLVPLFESTRDAQGT